MKNIYTTVLLLLSISVLHAQTGNVGIGTAVPNASSALDITDASRGLLIPRVALTATNAAGPVTSPANSLLVYNTATASSGATLVTPGYYYWNGGNSTWVRLLNGKSVLANNGLTTTNDTLIQLGGALTQPTIISAVTATNKLSVTATGVDAINLDGTTFSVDATNHRVGIGNAAPGAKLDVNGGATQAVLNINGTSNPEITLQNAGSPKLEIGIPTAANAYITGSATNDVIFRQTGGQKMLFSTSTTGATNDLILSAGNAGIGLTPAAVNRLDVVNPTGQTTSGAAINAAATFANTTNLNGYALKIANTFTGTGNPGYTIGADITATGATQDTRALTINATSSATTYGVLSNSSGTGGTNYAVYGSASNGTSNNYGIYGTASGTNAFAGYFSGNVDVTSLAGTGNRSVYADASGVLKAASNRTIAYAVDRSLRSFSSTAGGGSGAVTISPSTTSLAVEAGDIIKISASFQFCFSSGSGNDDMFPILQITGCATTSQQFANYQQNWDNDRDELQPQSEEWIYVATCSGNLQFYMQINAEANADDNYRTSDMVLVATKY